jgi:hypothetical protein
MGCFKLLALLYGSVLNPPELGYTLNVYRIFCYHCPTQRWCWTQILHDHLLGSVRRFFPRKWSFAILRRAHRFPCYPGNRRIWSILPGPNCSSRNRSQEVMGSHEYLYGDFPCLLIYRRYVDLASPPLDYNLIMARTRPRWRDYTEGKLEMDISFQCSCCRHRSCAAFNSMAKASYRQISNSTGLLYPDGCTRSITLIDCVCFASLRHTRSWSTEIQVE